MDPNGQGHQTKQLSSGELDTFHTCPNNRAVLLPSQKQTASTAPLLLFPSKPKSLLVFLQQLLYFHANIEV